MLAWTIYISFLGVLVLMLLPKGNAAAARKVALLSALAGLLVALAGFVQFKAGEIVAVAKLPWIPSLGIEFHLAADGISLTLVLLTGLAAVKTFALCLGFYCWSSRRKRVLAVVNSLFAGVVAWNVMIIILCAR